LLPFGLKEWQPIDKDAAMITNSEGFDLSSSTFGADEYTDLAMQIDGLLSGETDAVANLANAAAAIYHTLPALNWAGFYIARGGELVLGPFQGQPACARIPMATAYAGRRRSDMSRCWCLTCMTSRGTLLVTPPPGPNSWCP
jgi:GAF domain-containing protein